MLVGKSSFVAFRSWRLQANRTKNERVIVKSFSGNECFSFKDGITWWPSTRWTPNRVRWKGVVRSFLVVWVTSGLNKNWVSGGVNCRGFQWKWSRWNIILTFCPWYRWIGTDRSFQGVLFTKKSNQNWASYPSHNPTIPSDVNTAVYFLIRKSGKSRLADEAVPASETVGISRLSVYRAARAPP